MTSFVHVEQPASHPGVERAGAIIDRLHAMRRKFDGARGLAALLLAAIVSSVLVVADKLMAATDEGGLIVAWLVLWGVAFVALALFAGTARKLAIRLATVARHVGQRRAAARADEKLMAFAQHDPRILSELQVIASFRESDESTGATSHRAMRRVGSRQRY